MIFAKRRGYVLMEAVVAFGIVVTVTLTVGSIVSQISLQQMRCRNRVIQVRQIAEKERYKWRAKLLEEKEIR